MLGLCALNGPWLQSTTKAYDESFASEDDGKGAGMGQGGGGSCNTALTRTLVAEDLNNKSRSSSVTVVTEDTDSSSDDIVETASASGMYLLGPIHL